MIARRLLFFNQKDGVSNAGNSEPVGFWLRAGPGFVKRLAAITVSFGPARSCWSQYDP
ncbi:hypothetical protein QH494_08890 [Sphingomonas sp. AR_OL41]|uniref:hypothetical protein n=1 Tax=Sphingomonas sp. AR_OL41 TaxID=3042729 RepID=UPI00248184EC|nr:hypothetical protein [Sphingomonas sp. AR_OL41]MDH7972296.1 hypothetical protein [Sphingomonas sp. AR_OL41]